METPGDDDDGPPQEVDRQGSEVLCGHEGDGNREQNAADRCQDRNSETFEETIDQQAAALETGREGATEDSLCACQTLTHPRPVDRQHRDGPDAVGEEGEEQRVAQEGVGDHGWLAPVIWRLPHAGCTSMAASWPPSPRSSAGTPA